MGLLQIKRFFRNRIIYVIDSVLIHDLAKIACAFVPS